MATPDNNGDIIRVGGKHLDAGGYDLLGVLTGSEGLLAVITDLFSAPDIAARAAQYQHLFERA